ncbi:MAG: hypothetical protein NTZ21_09585 [Actinobacteria bacterium]|nr:hypothetical protein [Actinomycetota bacterium]
MSGLTQLRDGLVERSTSLLDDASHLAERGAHTAARLAEDQASALRSSLPASLPRSMRHRGTPSMASRSSKLGLVVALAAIGAAVYLWRAKRHAAATADYLDVHEPSHRGQEFRVAS